MELWEKLVANSQRYWQLDNVKLIWVVWCLVVQKGGLDGKQAATDTESSLTFFRAPSVPRFAGHPLQRGRYDASSSPGASLKGRSLAPV